LLLRVLRFAFCSKNRARPWHIACCIAGGLPLIRAAGSSRPPRRAGHGRALQRLQPEIDMDTDPSMTYENAIAMLKADHRKVESLFKEFEGADDAATQERLAREIVQELAVHAELEEQVFYPAVQAALGEEASDLVMEAVIEHGSLKMLIGQIEDTEPGDELFKPSVKVLKEYVQHHVKEEENQMMPKASRAGVDLEALGEEMAALKLQLLGKPNGARREGRGQRSASARRQ
jgi:hemerythrin superfamily protein